MLISEFKGAGRQNYLIFLTLYRVMQVVTGLLLIFMLISNNHL